MNGTRGGPVTVEEVRDDTLLQDKKQHVVARDVLVTV